MKEHYRNAVNVLGIDVSVMRPDKAVAKTLELMRRKTISTVFFHTSHSSLFCQTQEWGAEFIQDCDLVLAGDRYMESVVEHIHPADNIIDGNGEFADDYLRKLLNRLNKEAKSIFVIVSKEEDFQAIRTFIYDHYSWIELEGIVVDESAESDGDRAVNEINASIPDVVFVCLPVEQQLAFAKEYSPMMNTRLIIFIEAICSYVQKENDNIPHIIKKLHMQGLYRWISRERCLHNTIVGSIFRRRAMGDNNDNSDDENSIHNNSKDN